MSDPIEEMFTRARPAAVLTVRPPGAEAARRTVRIRRRRRVVSVAALVVLAVVGGALARMPGPAPTPQLPATPLELSKTAKAALGHADTPAFEKNVEVRSGWKMTSFQYFGELTLSAACAGAGSTSLAVYGIPGSESLTTEPIEVTRLTVACAATPRPVETKYLLEGFLSVEYRIEDSTSADGRSGLAFRVTSDTGKPLTDHNDEANTTNALHLTEDQSMNGYGLAASVSYERRVRDDDLPDWIGGRFKVFTACAGIGSLKLEIRRAGGKVVDTETVPCHWPPKRYDWAPARGSGDLRLRITYLPTTDSQAPARFSVQFEPKK